MKRLSDMSDAELAALGQRMIAAAPIVLEATAEVSDDAGELPDDDVEDSSLEARRSAVTARQRANKPVMLAPGDMALAGIEQPSEA
jgi:hypothetical protein